MAGLPYNCRCFTVTGAVAGMPNPSATGNGGGGGGGGSVGDKSTSNPNLGVALPPSAIYICNTNVVVPAGTPFLVLATGAGGSGGTNGNYGDGGSPSTPMARMEVTGGAGGSGQPLCAYFYAKDYAVTLSAQCGVGGHSLPGPGCPVAQSGSNGGDGTSTIVTIGTQTAFLLPGKGGTGGSGGSNIACGYAPPIPLGGGGWKSGGEGSIIIAPCSPPISSNCWTTNGVGITPVPQLAVGGASIFGPGGAISTGCSFYPNNPPAPGAGGSGGGGAHFANCGVNGSDGYHAQAGGGGTACVILNPSNAILQAYGLLP